MFAVPGWSVSADALTAQQLPGQSGGAAKSKSKKRKRPSSAVNGDNVGSMWEKVIEGKAQDGDKAGQESKRRKKAEKDMKKKNKAAAAAADEAADEGVQLKSTGDGADGEVPQEQVKEQKPAKDKKEKKEKKGKDKKNKDKRRDNESTPTTSKSQDAQPLNPQPAQLPVSLAQPSTAKLTPLQAAMRAKLIPARFRHLNETLYTRPSDEAFRLFQESPEMFDEYHAGFRQQVEVWPENPVNGYLALIRQRAAHTPPPAPRNDRDRRGPRRPAPPPPVPDTPADGNNLAAIPLPRTRGHCTIADLGCGDAKLASSLQVDAESLRVTVKSYDLQSPHPLVTKADIANLPLEDGSVNVAIFCLALMGTNWLDFIEEAYRILHWKGELWVAEIKSRFGRPATARKNAVVAHSVGNRKKAAAVGAAGAKKKGGAAGPDFSQDLAVEVDGQDDRRNETDVSAFVEALRKRGFLLRGDNPRESVDLSNRMFVKMYFVKGAIPSAAEEGAGDKNDDGGSYARRGKAKAWPPVVENKVDENAILKPCVYKLR